MRSPRCMRIIQIEITNACDKRCSNCTRLCGHQQKPFFMDFDTFRRAVDSLDGYQGIRSIMGGEPTLHPEFERFVRYLGSKFPKRSNPFVYPQKDFIRKVHQVELNNYVRIEDEGAERYDVIGAGVYSNMGPLYKKYYEVITDTAPYQSLNDHINPCYHQAALITRKDLGISDDEWIALRDRCWMQNQWSASITPKGAFFCEIASVLDMLLDGPGGWSIEPGWWKRTPDEFGDQLHWCELCGFALTTFSRDSSEVVDDMSPEWYERLKRAGSPKLKDGHVNVVKIENGKIAEESKRSTKFFSAQMPYIERYGDRFNAEKSLLFAHAFDVVTIPDGERFGEELNRALRAAKEWLVLKSENVALSADFEEAIGKYVLNPGTLHYIDLSQSDDARFVANADQLSAGYAALLNKNALSLREFGFDRIAHTRSMKEIVGMWKPDRVVELSSAFDRADDCASVSKDARYAIWGVGNAGRDIAEKILEAGGTIAFAFDANPEKQGCDFYGVPVQSPRTLSRISPDRFDALIAANYTRFPEIKRQAMDLGVPEERIQYINALLA